MFFFLIRCGLSAFFIFNLEEPCIVVYGPNWFLCDKKFVYRIINICFGLHYYSLFSLTVKIQELNTTEDFISLYDEVFSCTQTLPLVLLHKETIISKLLSRLHMKARLSLEPILRYASHFENRFIILERDVSVIHDEMVLMNKSYYCYSHNLTTFCTK
jgi:hypothetical protein